MSCLHRERKKEILRVLQFKNTSSWWTHLVIPMNGVCIPFSRFYNNISKTDNTLSSWRAKLLSFAGKIVLIKSIIISIPIFCLAGHKVPLNVIDKIERLIRDFLWRHYGNSNCIHYISRAQITKSKEE